MLHTGRAPSRRQLQVAGLLAAGSSDVEIAERLGLGVRTVESHVGALLRNSGHRTRAELGYDGLVESLSGRQRQVLDHLLRGLSNPAIGQELGVGARTVDTHVRRIFDKLGVRDRVAVIAMFGEAAEIRRRV